MEQHDRRLTEILRTEIKGEIPNALVIAKETQFYNHKGKLVCEPDGIIWDGKTLHLLEYKCNGGTESKALTQLNTAQRFIENELGILVPFHQIFKYG